MAQLSDKSPILSIIIIAILLGCSPGSESRRHMKVFWNDQGKGPLSDAAIEVDVDRVTAIWMDTVRGCKGNFLGLIDDNGRTIQFYWDEGIPDHVDDPGHMEIIYMDFPISDLQGSYGRHIKVMDAIEMISRAFDVGVDHTQFDGLTFEPW